MSHEYSPTGTIDLAEVEAFLTDIRHSAEAPRP